MSRELILIPKHKYDMLTSAQHKPEELANNRCAQSHENMQTSGNDKSRHDELNELGRKLNPERQADWLNPKNKETPDKTDTPIKMIGGRSQTQSIPKTPFLT